VSPPDDPAYLREPAHVRANHASETDLGEGVPESFEPFHAHRANVVLVADA
jgi:hypothetical protein